LRRFEKDEKAQHNKPISTAETRSPAAKWHETLEKEEKRKKKKERRE
jgi:hypothetical protein